MPEGDTLWRTAAALRPRLVDKDVLEAKPAGLSRLKGRRVLGVESKGKHLLMRFEGDLVLHSHMRMTGAWHVYAPGQPWRKPARHASAVLFFEDVVAVLFSAPVAELVRDEARVVGHLGPDILAETFDANDLARRARSSTRAEVGDMLLDQRVCAGIGNIYRCETLWIQRLDPWAPVAGLADERLAALFVTARDLMRRSLPGRGFRIRRAVHGRSGRPCPRCGSAVATRAQGELGRITYFCPRCQAPGHD